VENVDRGRAAIGEKGYSGDQANEQTLDDRQGFGETEGVSEEPAGALLRRIREFAFNSCGKPEAEQFSPGRGGLVAKPFLETKEDVPVAFVQAGFLRILVQVAEILEINNVLIVP
jgi:hypothetical protein